ncbi:MAG: lysylphosphatidylglycerol synthase transmembrane domain-containing protein [Candidatus Nanopelagicales bacterium]
MPSVEGGERPGVAAAHALESAAPQPGGPTDAAQPNGVTGQPKHSTGNAPTDHSPTNHTSTNHSPATLSAGTHSTLIIEEGVFRARLRRPRDILGAILALLVASAAVAIAYAAKATSAAIDNDLQAVQGGLPSLVALLINALAGLGMTLLPMAAAVSMLLRRRGRQLLESILALTLATIVLNVLSSLVITYGSARLNNALSGMPAGSVALGSPTQPLLGGMVAFVVTARLLSRPRWNIIASLVIGSAAFVTLVSAPTTAAAIGASIALGIAIGLLVRYALGTPTTRPSGADVATTLVNGGFPLVMLRAEGGHEAGRRYQAVTVGGQALAIVVLDRDLEGSGVFNTIWRAIRLRESDRPRNELSMRAELDRAALMAYAAQAGGVPTPRLRMAAQVNADASLLAYEVARGRQVPISATPQSDAPTDAELDAAWRAAAALQSALIAHRRLSPEAIQYAGADTQLTILEGGSVAASDVLLRVDLAELLTTQALQTDVSRALASARRVVGDEAILRALPAMQKVAFSSGTRAALRVRKEVLADLREELLAVNPQIDVQPINLERVRLRTVLTVVLGTLAGYLLLSQLAQVNLQKILSTADWRWAGLALGLSALTYVGATLALSGFVSEPLRFWKTFQAQLAASFATLVSPPTLGAVAVNGRYLNRAGLPPAAAAATIGVSQVAAFIVHILLLLLMGVAAGTQTDLDFDPPRGAIIGLGLAALVLGGLTSISAVRTWLATRIRPMVDQVVPRLLTVAQRPAKLVEGFGGILLLNLAYCLCLLACCRAFTDSLTVAAISFVYLAGSTLGQAAPTPGGLGVVEAALAAGLTAAGMESGVAVSAVLLFRLLTFWLPIFPGWLSFRSLANQDLL